MKSCKWTLGLAAAGIVTLPSVLRGEEQLSPVLTTLSSTTISGYVNTSAQWNPGTGNANPPAVVFNPGKQDGFNLDVIKLALERAPDEAQWSAGYKVDLWVGPDANTLGSQQLNRGDFAVKQAYVQLKTPIHNGLDFKLGVWDTIMGFEVLDSPNNRNYSRSYGFTLEPVTHTGLLATWQLNSALTVAAGVSDTFGPQINARAHPPQGPKDESYKTYMASATFTAPESFGFLKDSTFTVSVMNGFNSAAPVNAAPGFGPADQTSLYAGALINTPVRGLQFGAAFDYVLVGDQPLTAQTDTYAEAFGLYASYKFTEKLALHARGEYAQSDTFILGPKKVFETTATLQYDLWSNVLTRLEFRWDRAATGGDAFGGQVAGAPNRRNAFMLAANAIYKF